jgi:hypothetical protein
MDEEHLSSQIPPAQPLPPAIDGPVSPPPIPSDWLSRLLLPAYESKGWLRFLGVVCIAGGALSAITIVGLIVAWLYVWVGVLLWQAGDRVDQAYLRHDPAIFEQFLHKLKTLITIAGVATVLSLAVGVIGLLMALSFGWLALIASRLGA